MLKLIVNNATSSDEKVLPHKTENYSIPPQNSFFYDLQELSSNLYVLRAKDFHHELTCEITLELTDSFFSSNEENSEEGYIAPVITCNFPPIDVQQLNQKICWDEYLHGIIMFQFQLKILEQLLLLCQKKDVAYIILTIPNTNLDYLEIYRRFIISEEQVLIARVDQTQIVIPTDVKTYNEIIALMGEVDDNLHKTLWRGQSANPIFRKYLKENALS